MELTSNYFPAHINTIFMAASKVLTCDQDAICSTKELGMVVIFQLNNKFKHKIYLRIGLIIVSIELPHP